MARHLTREPIRPETFPEALADDGCGATVTFSGIVRNTNNGRAVSSIDYEAEERMADSALAGIFEEMKQAAEGPCVLVHRLGHLEIGEISIFIQASSAHRGQAFRAVRDAIEAVKARVPIWKNEHYADGTSEWLDGKCIEPHGRLDHGHS